MSIKKHASSSDGPTRDDDTFDYEDRILISIRRMIRAVDLYSKELAQKYTLTGPQLVCLRMIRKAGTITPSELAGQVSLSQATVTGILDRLEARGCLSRTRHAQDRRRVVVALTETGVSLVESVPSPLHERFARRLRALSEAERAEIDEILSRIVEMMEAEDLDAAPLLSSGPILASPAKVKALMEEAVTDGEPGAKTLTDIRTEPTG
ncbi:MAG: MarR family winged helix-turn-helix transcriptional regulator [Bradymonadia bacterium]